jgi:hypothetical protein
VLGVKNIGDTQLLFVDTPGILQKRYRNVGSAEVVEAIARRRNLRE